MRSARWSVMNGSALRKLVPFALIALGSWLGCGGSKEPDGDDDPVPAMPDGAGTNGTVTPGATGAGAPAVGGTGGTAVGPGTVGGTAGTTAGTGSVEPGPSTGGSDA